MEQHVDHVRHQHILMMENRVKHALLDQTLQFYLVHAHILIHAHVVPFLIMLLLVNVINVQLAISLNMEQLHVNNAQQINTLLQVNVNVKHVELELK